MASSKEYLDFILEQLSELNDVSYRVMIEYTGSDYTLNPEYWKT